MPVSVDSYSTRLTVLYFLLLADGTINATVEANVESLTALLAAFVLAIQVLVRIGCIGTTVSILAASHAWRDDFLLDYCAYFSVSLIGLILCLFLRVYRVTLATFPSRFPSPIDYWSSSEYCIMVLINSVFSLLFYYMSISAAHRMGSAKHFAHRPGQIEGSDRTRSLYTAVQLAAQSNQPR